MTTDLALIGRLGDAALAAAALAHTVFFISFTFGMGLVSAVAPLAAQAFGDASRGWCGAQFASAFGRRCLFHCRS